MSDNKSIFGIKRNKSKVKLPVIHNLALPFDNILDINPIAPNSFGVCEIELADHLPEISDPTKWTIVASVAVNGPKFPMPLLTTARARLTDTGSLCVEVTIFNPQSSSVSLKPFEITGEKLHLTFIEHV